MSKLDDILPYRLPTIVRLDNGNRVVAFSVPADVFERIEPELNSVSSVYEEGARGSLKDRRSDEGT
jgi:hypothetical protein